MNYTTEIIFPSAKIGLKKLSLLNFHYCGGNCAQRFNNSCESYSEKKAVCCVLHKVKGFADDLTIINNNSKIISRSLLMLTTIALMLDLPSVLTSAMLSRI